MIYENILRSIATVRGECTTKHGNMASYNTDYTQNILFLISLTSFGLDWKSIEEQNEKSKIFVYEKCCTEKKLFWFKYFPWIFWAHYKKIMLRPVSYPNENQTSNNYFQIFSVMNLLRTGWIKQLFHWEPLSISCSQVGCF